MIQPTYTQFNPQLNTQYPQPNGANAVSINIINPQAYGSAPQGAQASVPMAQSSMYQMPQTQMYQMPQAQMYQMPQTQMYQMPQAQQGFFQPNVAMQNPMVAAPAPQMMPESVMTQEQTVQQQPETKDVKTTENTNTESASNVEKVNVDELVNNLKSTDVNVKHDTIDKIAKYVTEGNPEIALQVVSEPVMQGLIDVIKEDTSSLEGPSQKQIDIAEKNSKGEKLTPEETEILNQTSPRDAANGNRIIALYTLAMIQKLQRDEIAQYIESQKANGEQPINQIKLEELLGYNDIVNIINNDSRPEVKVAAIQALQHVANPEDKAVVEKVLAESLKSTDEAIKGAANEAMSKFNAQ